MKYLTIGLIALLAGCGPAPDEVIRAQRVMINTTCVDGIKYFLIHNDTQWYIASPKINPKTLMPERCDNPNLF